MSDPLKEFKVWEGEELGPNQDLPAGFHGLTQAPVTILHCAGAWAMSSARKDRAGVIHPVVYSRVILRAVGKAVSKTGENQYHILDIIVDEDIAEQWAATLKLCAARARKDVRAGIIHD